MWGRRGGCWGHGLRVLHVEMRFKCDCTSEVAVVSVEVKVVEHVAAVVTLPYSSSSQQPRRLQFKSGHKNALPHRSAIKYATKYATNVGHASSAKALSHGKKQLKFQHRGQNAEITGEFWKGPRKASDLWLKQPSLQILS
eukprot:1160828-Pelagomonas_calceolata.AAC.14